MDEEIDEVARAARRSEEGALEKLLSSLTFRLQAYFRRRVQDSDAQDLVQITLSKVTKHLTRFDPQKKFEPWVFTIAYRTLLDFLQPIRPTQITQEGEAKLTDWRNRDPLDQVINEEDTERLQMCLDKLSEEERVLIVMKFSDNLGDTEIGRRQGERRATVWRKLHRAIGKLRDCMHFGRTD